MDVLTLLFFVSAVVLLTITPGPDLFLIVGRGISQGRKMALFTCLGFFLAGFVQVPLLAFGLATFVAEYPVLFDVLRYGGGAYLIWRGLVMIIHGTRDAIADDKNATAIAATREGFIASLVNPKSHVFLLTFLPQFVDPSNGSVMAQFVILGILMRIIALLVECGIAFFVGSVGENLRQSLRLRYWLERIAGGLLIAIGLRLLILDQPQDAVLKS